MNHNVFSPQRLEAFKSIYHSSPWISRLITLNGHRVKTGYSCKVRNRLAKKRSNKSDKKEREKHFPLTMDHWWVYCMWYSCATKRIHVNPTLFLGNRNPLNRNRRIGASAWTGTLSQWQQGSGATLHNSDVNFFNVTFTIFVCLMSSLDRVL